MHDTLQQPARVVHGRAPDAPRWRDADQELRAGLRAAPPRIAPKFLYDARGCELYEAICALPEYYLPRVERAILDRHQAALLRLLPDEVELIDLGSGDGQKARRWLDTGIVRRYIGIDIAEDWLRACLHSGQRDYPDVRFDGVVTDLCWGLQLPLAREAGRARLFCYPGSSIGNFEPQDAITLLRQLRAHMQAGDKLLLAVDGPTDRARMERAYDDTAGVTAAFDLNVLRVVNRRLGADFDPAAFRHQAWFNDDASRIEMHLVATRDQTVALGAGPALTLRAGQHIVTEHSYKHSPARVERMLHGAGFQQVRRFGIEGEAYGVYLAGIDDVRH